MNMLNKLIITFSFFLFSFLGLSQNDKFKFKDLKDMDIYIRKAGFYIGYQRGKFDNAEIGFERQWKHVKLLHPKTFALHAGLNYNFINNTIGYEVGGYRKTGRMEFTYGANVLYYTDFTHNRIGFTPVIGYKLYGFHLQAGVNLLTPSPNFKDVNSFFLSLRFFVMKEWRMKVK